MSLPALELNDDGGRGIVIGKKEGPGGSTTLGLFLSVDGGQHDSQKHGHSRKGHMWLSCAT